MEHLRIGDDQRGWLFERSERGSQLGIAHQIRQRSPIEQITRCLHLGQDKSALGRFLVDRNDEHDRISWIHQVTRKRRILKQAFRGGIDDRLEQLTHACALSCRNAHRLIEIARTPIVCSLIAHSPLACKVDLVRHDHRRDRFTLKIRQQIALRLSPRALLIHEQRQVAALHRLARGLSTQLPHHFGIVVDPRRVDEEHRAKRQKFHRSLDRVGRGAGHFTHDAHGLARERIHHAALARIAPAEQPDRDAHPLRRGRKRVTLVKIERRGRNVVFRDHGFFP